MVEILQMRRRKETSVKELFGDGAVKARVLVWTAGNEDGQGWREWLVQQT